MQGVGFTHDVDRVNLDRIIKAVENRLARQPSFKVTFHRPLVRPEAVALIPQPVEPVIAVRTAIREAMSGALAGASVPEGDAFQPHVSLAYSNREHPTADVIRALDEISPEPVQATIDHAALIELHRDNRMYEWRTIALTPLATTPGSVEKT